jgi:hypothetical protein
MYAIRTLSDSKQENNTFCNFLRDALRNYIWNKENLFLSFKEILSHFREVDIIQTTFKVPFTFFLSLIQPKKLCQSGNSASERT